MFVPHGHRLVGTCTRRSQRRTLTSRLYGTEIGFQTKSVTRFHHHHQLPAQSIQRKIPQQQRRHTQLPAQSIQRKIPQQQRRHTQRRSIALIPPTKDHAKWIRLRKAQKQKRQTQRRYIALPPKNQLNDPNLTNLKKTKDVEIAQLVEKLDVRLTDAELRLLKKQLDRNGDGYVSNAELAYAGHKARMERTARELALDVVEQPESKMDKLGQETVKFFDYTGTALFSIVGTLTAGDAGMNIIGCCLVGCVASLGGGTMNHLFYGGSILGKSSSVFWVRIPAYLAVAAGASILTFFTWPMYVAQESTRYLSHVFDGKKLNRDGSCGREEFVRACQKDKKLLHTCREAFPFARPAVPQHYFDLLDTNHSGSIDHAKLKALVQKSFENSTESYVLDTAALAAFSVAAVNGAIGRGLHPLVAATSGVTVCFGGVFRDLFCQREGLAIASQSYAFCTGAGSLVYVMMREMTLRGHRISLFGRVCVSAGTVIVLRVWEFFRGSPLLSPMHGGKTAEAKASIQRMGTLHSA